MDGSPKHTQSQPLIVQHSLLKQFLPVTSDKVPNQRLPSHIAGDVDDGVGGILLPDVVWVQSVTQVPVGSRQG